MKRIISGFVAICIVLCMTAPLLALASDANAEVTDVPAAQADSGNGSNVNITVMLPVQAVESETTSESEASLPAYNYSPLYPVDVSELYSESGRQIIKTYELTADENPEDISRDGFERDGWRYELTDITKKETTSAAAREHTETRSIDTSSRDIDVILDQLAPTLEYQSGDGYIGILALDISTITVEMTGNAVAGYTVTAQYSGTISKFLTGRTIYTAYFIGKEIEAPTPEAEQEAEAVPTAEPPAETESAEEASPEISTASVPDNDGGLTSRLIVLIALALSAVVCGGCYFLRKNKKK